MPRTLLLLMLALPLAAMAALPSEFAAACRAFHTENPKGWSFTQVTKAEGRILVERYDAGQPDFNRWSLLQEDGRPPTESEARAYKEKFTRRSRGGQAPNISSQLDLASAEFVSETPERLVYRFRLKPEEDNDKTADFLRVSVTYHKPTGSIEIFELANLDPFSPVLGVKITELRTTLRYTLPEGDRPSLLDLVSTRTRGRAFFKSLDADRIVTYTDYAWAGKRSPPKR